MSKIDCVIVPAPPGWHVCEYVAEDVPFNKIPVVAWRVRTVVIVDPPWTGVRVQPIGINGAFFENDDSADEEADPVIFLTPDGSFVDDHGKTYDSEAHAMKYFIKKEREEDAEELAMYETKKLTHD